MMGDNDVDFTTLVGEHDFTGADSTSVRLEDWGFTEVADRLSFVLDGVTYTATENPSDGYRSSLDSLIVGGEVENTFAPVRVRAEYLTVRVYEGTGYTYTTQCDILRLVDVANGLPILEVGTDNNDDYYPSCVLWFDPAAMAINGGKAP